MSKTVRLNVSTATSQHDLSVGSRQQPLRLTDILRRHNLPLNTRCGERGLCDCCQVELLAGELVHVVTGKKVHSDGRPVLVRACEHRLSDGDQVRIHLPPRSLLASQPQVVSDFKVNVTAAHDPLRQWVKVEPGQLIQAQGDLGKLAVQLQDILGLALTPRLQPEVQKVWLAAPLQTAFDLLLERQENGWSVARLEPVTHSIPVELGAAIDIGTTTVVVMLCDLADGKILSRSAMFNRQMHLGDDVLTRINLCMTDPTMLDRFHEAIVAQTIQPLLLEALAQAGKEPGQVRCLALAGNTTMMHLLAHADPVSIGIAPFQAQFLHHRVLHEADLKWDMSLFAAAPVQQTCGRPTATEIEEPATPPAPTESGPPPALPRLTDCAIHLLPSAAGYIGADICAGVVSSGLIYDDGPSLLVDVGTNGEIVLKIGKHTYACATAAGPAFEGAGLACGSRAIAGAISHIRLNRSPFQLELEQIGDEKGSRPVGICGSAYIDFLCQARSIELIAESGRFNKDDYAALSDHWTEYGSYGQAFKLAMGLGHQPVVITEPDIARLLQAKAAIAAGILTLLNRCGLTPADVKTIYLAGGFGMHMNIANAIGCGLLPQFRKEQIELVGNTSLAGAYLALTDSSALDLMIEWSKKVEVVELNLDPEFESRYIDQLFLP